jgi:TRAP-type C4-dicarboxylate transport system substrate-binding protein
MVEHHRKINMYPLGTWLYDPFYLYVKKPVAKLDDLKGLKMRTAAKYDKMMKKLGIVPVTIEFGETYTALQRGVAEGFGWPTIGPREWGWLENTKYVIDIPFYARQNTLILMNLDAWNKLPKDVQAKLIDITVKFETEMKAYFEKAIATERAEMEKLGVKRIKLSPEETRKYLETADSAFLEDLEKKMPDQVIILRPMLGL